MRSTQELYRVPKSYFDGMTALETSTEKVRLAREHIEDLQKEHYTKRDDKLINEVLDAIEHHTFLINEE